MRIESKKKECSLERFFTGINYTNGYEPYLAPETIYKRFVTNFSSLFEFSHIKPINLLNFDAEPINWRHFVNCCNYFGLEVIFKLFREFANFGNWVFR